MASTKTTLKKTDDLFEKSTMTFGEHLEELRRALAKAFVWLAIGMGISLLFADRIVTYIQTPLQKSLEDFYQRMAENDWEKANDQPMDQSLKDFMRKYKRVPTISYVNPDEIAKAIEDAKELSTKANSDATSQSTSPVGEAETAEEEESTDETSTAKATHPSKAEALFGKEIGWLPQNFRADQLRPIRIWNPISTTTEALQVTEPFMIYIKAGLMAGLVLASPGIFWHIWNFVSAGLYPHERRYVFFFLPVSLGLFIGGAALAFFVIFQIVLDFLLDYNASMGINPSPRLNDYMSFALMLPLGFGIAFQLPMVMLILERIGICTTQTYVAQWRWAILIIAFISMLLTPGDITPMIAMMIPLVGLYYLGIALCKYLPRGTALGTGGYDAH